MNQNPTFTFELTLEETNVILAGLQEIPAKICNPISDKIKAQAQEQIAAMQTAQASEGAVGANAETIIPAGTNGPAE